MHVTFFHRKPRSGNHSIENVFNQIRNSLPPEVTWDIKQVSFHSKGFFKRLYICIESAFNQKEINHITGDINFVAIFLRKRYTVLTVHDVGFMMQSKSFYRFILKWFWIKLPVWRSAIITTVSEATKQELLKFVRIEASRIKVIEVPILPYFIPYYKEFNKIEPTILQVGTKYNKNVFRLVQALKGINCKLEIIGDVNEELLTILNESGIKFNISKDITIKEIVSKYCSSDVVVFASTYEGFGMPIVEANAIGRVVITSNILSMPEVAGDAAHLVNPFDVDSIRAGIQKVIDDDVYREKLISNGYRNRTRYDEHIIAEKYKDIYIDLMKNK